MSRSWPTRAQSSIIGVAVLVAVTALSVGALTVAAGTFVEDGVAAADAQRVANDLDNVGEHGTHTTRVEFSRGTLRVEQRTVRVLRDEATVLRLDAGALVYENRGRRVATLGGVVVDGQRNRSTLSGPLPVVVADDRVLVDVVALNASGATAVGGSTGAAATVRTNATHEYRTLRAGRYAVAIETSTPGAWERAVSEENPAGALGVERRDFDDDGVPSVVVSISGEATVDLAIHDLRAVVTRG
jgi:flagellin-like protein